MDEQVQLTFVQPPSPTAMEEHIAGEISKLDSSADLPAELRGLLGRRDGAARLADVLPRTLAGAAVADGSPMGRAWELFGWYYYQSGRYAEALLLFRLLYEQQLASQQSSGGQRIAKGTAMCWISDCHRFLQHPACARRYIMLTLVEEAINGGGNIVPESGGLYHRVVWFFGMPDYRVHAYVSQCWQIAQEHPGSSLHPEWVLQELDQEWMVDTPAPEEAMTYELSSGYAKWLLGQLGEGDGKQLERLAHYMVSCIPGCRARMRLRTRSTDYDVAGVLDGHGVDFRSELGRYFICECKDWSKPADVTRVLKLCRVLDAAKCRFGVIFSRKGITGRRATMDAAREQLKYFQDRGTAIVVVDESDLGRCADGANFITLLRGKYEAIRLDLDR